MGMAGCVADGNSGASSADDMLLPNVVDSAEWMRVDGQEKKAASRSLKWSLQVEVFSGERRQRERAH